MSYSLTGIHDDFMNMLDLIKAQRYGHYGLLRCLHLSINRTNPLQTNMLRKTKDTFLLLI